VRRDRGQTRHSWGGADQCGRNEREQSRGRAIAASCDVLFPVQDDCLFKVLALLMSLLFHTSGAI